MKSNGIDETAVEAAYELIGAVEREVTAQDPILTGDDRIYVLARALKYASNSPVQDSVTNALVDLDWSEARATKAKQVTA